MLAYINIGKYAEAVEVLNEAIRLKPDYLQARNNLAVAKSRLKEAESK
ncbi:MAG: tetratricopeptide repeat protein [Nitrospirae bacterium]|nr:tetratricopeptide repeat protein [Nitrospirota bacterium]